MWTLPGCISCLLYSERGWKQSQWKQENETGRKSSIRTQDFEQQGVSIRPGFPRWRLRVMGQGRVPIRSLFSFSPAKCLLIINHWGKFHCFLTLQKTYFKDSTSSWWKLISITKSVGQGQLFYLTEGNPSCEGLMCYGMCAAWFGFFSNAQ